MKSTVGSRLSENGNRILPELPAAYRFPLRSMKVYVCASVCICMYVCVCRKLKQLKEAERDTAAASNRVAVPGSCFACHVTH